MFDDTGSNEFDMESEVEEVSRREEIAAELQRIESKYGYLTPHFVVDEARPEDAPLHGRFEWDNDIAGERYREVQARTLIRVVVEKSDDREAPMFVHVTTEDGPRYMRAFKVASDKDLFAAALQELAAKLRQATKSLTELMAMGGSNMPPLKPLQKHLAAAEKALGRVQAQH